MCVPAAGDIFAITYARARDVIINTNIRIKGIDPPAAKVSLNNSIDSYILDALIYITYMSNWSFCTLSAYADLTLVRVALSASL